MPEISVPENSRWTVLELLDIRKRRRFCLAQCACGTIREVSFDNVRGGQSRSCGCIPRPGRPRQDYSERFWSKVDANVENGCWPWLDIVNQYGYGTFWDSDHQRNVGAHRIAYELLRGPIPDGLELDHLCRNTLCVNPDHLEPVTKSVNSSRGHVAREGRDCSMPLCPNEATIRRPDGGRVCPRHEHVHVSSTGSWLDNHSREDD